MNVIAYVLSDLYLEYQEDDFALEVNTLRRDIRHQRLKWKQFTLKLRTYGVLCAGKVKSNLNTEEGNIKNPKQGKNEQ